MLHAARMHIWATLQKLLPMLAVAGLVLSPVAQPAMAMPADMDAATANHAEMADHAAMTMSDGTPCCPHEEQKSDCGNHCPSTAICMVSLYSTLPDCAFSMPIVPRNVVALRDDRTLDSLSQRPPPRPPKT